MRQKEFSARIDTCVTEAVRAEIDGLARDMLSTKSAVTREIINRGLEGLKRDAEYVRAS